MQTIFDNANFFCFDHVSFSPTSSVFFTGDLSLVGEPPSRVRNSISFQIFITNYQSNKRKVWLLLAIYSNI